MISNVELMNQPAHPTAHQSAPAEVRRARIIVLDDEVELRAMLERYLTDHGYQVRAVADAAQLERLLAREPFNLLVLDLMMPGEDGLSLCRRLRVQGETIPILMLTARGDAVDRIVGLEMGADDYLSKPFNPRELLARIQAMLRRQSMQGTAPSEMRGLQDGAILRFGAFMLDIEKRQLKRGDAIIELKSGEFLLLRALATNPNRPLGRERLIELAKGRSTGRSTGRNTGPNAVREYELTERSIDVQVLRLRRMIESEPARPRHIQTVWGIGYVFVPNPDDAAPDRNVDHSAAVP
jgi:two-component system phosphate regulon response regulator OmpR